MKRGLFFIVFGIMIGSLYSQQVVMYSHYFYKPMVYNPAYTGLNNNTNIMLLNHTQWIGFKGGPQYNILTLDGNLINKNTGLGLSIVNDKKGVSNRIGGDLFYSYKLQFKENIFLRLGLSIGVINQSINFSNASIENPNDPYLFTNSQNKTTLDANAGLVFVLKKFELGLAVPQFAGQKINYISSNDSKISYKHSRHYMSSVKYKFILPKNKDLSITPQLLSRYIPNTPFQYDANVNFDWQNKFWIGGTYKSNYAIGINLGIILFKQLAVGYSYDYIIGNLNKYGGLSHEIMLHYTFSKKTKETKTDEQKEDEELEKLSQQDLNKILIEKINKKIEMLLDKGNATPEEIHALLDEIASFLDDDSTDPAQETLRKYYNSLKKQAQGEINVLVKGKIVAENSESPDNLKIKITVIDLGTKKTIGTSVPTKDGKYYFILKPSKKYQIIVESEGYKPFSKTISVGTTPESYEMSQEVMLTK